MPDEQLFITPINFQMFARTDANSKPWFDFAETLVRTGLALLNDIEVPLTDGRRFAAAGIFARAHESTQAAIVLLERGMVGDARSILRTAAEAAIALAALADDPDFGTKLGAAGKADSLKLVNVMLANAALRGEFDAQTIARLETTRDELKALPEHECKHIVWEQVAAKHCRDLYDTIYRLHSMDGVHINAGSLKRRFEMNDKDEVTMMKVGPDGEGLVGALYTTCAVFLHALEPFSRLYAVAGYAENVDAFVKDLKARTPTELDW